jgi:hypothetical protein
MTERRSRTLKRRDCCLITFSFKFSVQGFGIQSVWLDLFVFLFCFRRCNTVRYVKVAGGRMKMAKSQLTVFF